MLNSISSGSKVFIDSNIFIYHFTAHNIFGENCSSFLLRCASQEIIGYTSTNVIIETMHRLLIVEAVQTLHLAEYNVIKYLKEHSQRIKELPKHSELIEKIKEFNLTILQTSISDISNSH